MIIINPELNTCKENENNDCSILHNHGREFIELEYSQGPFQNLINNIYLNQIVFENTEVTWLKEHRLRPNLYRVNPEKQVGYILALQVHKRGYKYRKVI